MTEPRRSSTPETPPSPEARRPRDQQLPSPSARSNLTRGVIAVLPEVQRAGNRSDFSLSGGRATKRGIGGRDLTRTCAATASATGPEPVPSVEGIEEIRVSSISNNAEFATTGESRPSPGPGPTAGEHGVLNLNNESLNANPNYFNRAIPTSPTTRTTGPAFRAGLQGQDVLLPHVRAAAYRQDGVASATCPKRTSGRETSPLDDGDHRSAHRPAVRATSSPPTDQPGERAPALPVHLRSERGRALHRYSIDATESSNQVDLRLDHNFSPRTRRSCGSAARADRLSPTITRPRSRRFREPDPQPRVLGQWGPASVLNEFRFATVVGPQAHHRAHR